VWFYLDRIPNLASFDYRLPLGQHTPHSANAILLLILFQRLTIPGPWLAAAIFAMHPVQLESVAWISERKNVLSGFFYLLALLCYLRCKPFDLIQSTWTRRQWQYYAVTLVYFVCALLSKSVTCSLPAIILLLVWWKKGASLFWIAYLLFQCLS